MSDQAKTTPGGVIEHSSIVGGSTAGKRLACPGSYKMEQKLPATVDISNAFADEGSALHDCIAYMLDNDIVDVDEVRGMVFRDYVMTDDLIDRAIVPSMQFFDDLCDAADAAGEGPLEFLVEKRCELPGIPNAFGTSDIIWKTTKRSGILDWKFGEGVPVKAIYLDDEKGDLLNPQLMFYGRAAQHTFPDFFGTDKEWPVEIIIYQPRVREDAKVSQLPDSAALTFNIVDADDGRVTYAMTSIAELESYRYALVRAVAEATGDSPRIEKGEHCRFAKCKTICPLFTGPVLDLSKLVKKGEKGKELAAAGGEGFDWGAFFATVLNMKAVADTFFSEAAQQAHQYMESGFSIPGWKLVDKKAIERYIDEAGAARHAIGMGVPEEHVYTEPAIKSPAQLRAELEPFMEGKTKKARTEAAKEEIGKFTEKKSSGTTIAHEDDGRRDVLSPSAAVKALADKLAALG